MCRLEAMEKLLLEYFLEQIIGVILFKFWNQTHMAAQLQGHKTINTQRVL